MRLLPWVFAAIGTSFGLSTAIAQQGQPVQVLSATIKDEKIPNATVIVQRNGEQSITAVTDAGGRATITKPFHDDASTLVIIRKEGYSDLVAKCPCAGLSYALSPVMTKLDGLRIVLSWGANPPDLDGHLTFEGQHVFFGNKIGPDVNQDVDNTRGYGPETITVSRKHDGKKYFYFVHDYSERTNATDGLALSGAKVFVYVGQTLIRTYYVPSGVGNLWEVFEITEDGEFRTINKLLVHNVLSGSVLGNLDPDTNTELAVAPPPQAPQPVSDEAKRINTKGESAYRAGNYEEAIGLFREAINLNDNYGQAYSNLALVFRKVNRTAEALWADRKAIALASGPNAATTRASSHYNDGRIYEDAGQWNDALREYLAAKAEKSNPVYDNAINRMKQQLSQ